MNSPKPLPTANRESRAGELTAVLGREKFDWAPNGITDPDLLERWGKFRYDYHRAHKLQFIPDFPLQIDFELNSACNMKCSFCVHGMEKVAPAALPWDSFTKIIDEGAKHGLTSIKMNYINEPLLVSNLEDYIRYARSKGVLNIYFATNGLLLTEKRGRSLIEAGVSKIMVSLDATTSETFQAMRQSTKFDKIVQNVENFIKLRDSMGISHPLVRVNFVRTPINSHEEEDFVTRWAKVADMIGIQDQVCRPGQEDDLVVRHDLEGFRCAFPFKLMVVDANGDILPCCVFMGRTMPSGNVRDTTISEAWNSQGVTALRKIHQEGKWHQQEACRRCVGGTA